MIPFERRLISSRRSPVVHRLFKLLSAQRVFGYFQSRQSAKCITEVSLQLSVRMLKGGDRINMLISKKQELLHSRQLSSSQAPWTHNSGIHSKDSVSWRELKDEELTGCSFILLKRVSLQWRPEGWRLLRFHASLSEAWLSMLGHFPY